MTNGLKKKIDSNLKMICKLFLPCLMIILSHRCCCATLFDVSTMPTMAPVPITTPATSAAATNRDITIGPCKWAIGRSCPDPDIKYYIYTRHNLMDRQSLQIAETLEKSNLTDSFFNPRHPSKILIHGYNSDMFLNPLQRMRDEYLAKDDYNIFYVDWSVLSPGPCYISAVHNVRQAGACAAQLVERLVETGNTDIHIIGFSLGAQVPNYIARTLKTFKLPRITGLDPAMPLFVTAGVNDKLDPSDADFVDVIHTNAMVQGKLERCGHADFYMNGGISQPGCTGWMNSFACSHQRATAYYLESIRSPKGFWGWSCSGYISYLLGMCPATNYLLEAGDNTRPSTRGMFLIDTNDTSPYALGKWTDLPTLGVKNRRILPTPPPQLLRVPSQNVDPLLQHIDQFGKLSGNFNNLPNDPSHVVNPYEHWTSYSPPQHKESESESYNSVEEQGTSGESEDIEDRQLNTPLNWWDYRRNLTQGYIDNSVFSMPKVH